MDLSVNHFVIGQRVGTSRRWRRHFDVLKPAQDARWNALLSDPRWERIHDDDQGFFVLRQRSGATRDDGSGTTPPAATAATPPG
jgi:hypothetical protein